MIKVKVKVMSNGKLMVCWLMVSGKLKFNVGSTTEDRRQKTDDRSVRHNMR